MKHLDKPFLRSLPVLFTVLQIAIVPVLRASEPAAERQLLVESQAYMEALLELQQPAAYFDELPLEQHHRFYDNTPVALGKFRDVEDRVLASLRSMSPSLLKDDNLRSFHATFTERLEGSLSTRVCRTELWSVSHMGGPHTDLDLLVEYQPVASAQDRLDALARWTHAGRYFRQEIENLKSGLAAGYSAPKRVVARVVKQLDGITTPTADEHPFMALAERADNQEFTRQFKLVLEQQLLPALNTYQNYLSRDYLPAARTELGVHAIPNGRECYIALYRQYTTLQRTPEQVFELGSKAVEENKRAVTLMGKTLYGSSSFEDTIAAANNDESQKFNSAEAMQKFYVNVVERAKKAMVDYFYTLPEIEMVVEPIPVHQQGSGRSAHYRPGNADRPGTFAYDPSDYLSANFGSAEIVTVHEGYPGHHMQIGLVQALPVVHPVQRAFWNSAFGEGWARYAETLAEEAGIYHSKSAPILRRAWPARGMVADPGMHLLGWSNQKVRDFLVESGMPDIASDPDALMDRMAIIPAQLTSYDSGALEIFALREKFRAARGDDFDLREFHNLILEHGAVPLSTLREKIEVASQP